MIWTASRAAPGPRDVLCQHILITACAGPFDADALFHEVRSAGAYATLSRAAFDDCLDFCATGGYALRAYDHWQRLMQRPDGLWQLRDPRAAQRIRMNIGTIQDTDTAQGPPARRGGKPLGEVEESFAATLTPGDTFLIGGQIVRYEGLREMTVEVSRATRQPAEDRDLHGHEIRHLDPAVAAHPATVRAGRLARPARPHRANG